MDFTIPTTDNWQEQLEYIVTKKGFNFTQDEDGNITLQKFSPWRQDFTIELIKPLDYRDALDDLNAQLASYDVNDEAMVWYGANRGEPRDLQDLLDDMKWCKNELQELTDAVDYHLGFSPADYFNEVVMEDALATTFEQAGLEEITTHGCVSGVLTDFIYYSDTKEFYTKHIDDIESFIDDLENDLGEPIALEHPRYNNAVWLVTEESARLASDSLEENIQNTLEAWSEDLTKEQVEAFLQGNNNELISDHLEETLSFLEEDLEEKQDARLDTNSEAPKIVVPSSPVQEQAQAILNARGENNDNTLKNAQEEQEERKTQSHKL